ncbi:conjugal transfer protein TraX [Aquincola sp. S2]|uniref:Conjugal transfer protein TraX n=1 Tax=Pseudaquabacterium terrae TaxID=2732868 RepID=A0ABX2ESA9_9BURK|nr:TraX family protein [Aquabacterium terrae]NRF71381.1 conjugal transfer protein TraX [Aquabacterium terrae]
MVVAADNGGSAPAAPTRTPNSASAARLLIADGTLEALKWLALLLMTVDHVNKYLRDWSTPWMFSAGRLAMPIFAVVLAYNLARSETLAAGAYQRTMKHLAIGAAVSTVPFVALGKVQFAGGWLPLNILATLLVATAVMYLLELGGARRMLLAAVVFIVGGALVEFWWPAIGMAVAAQHYFRRPSFGTAAAVIVCTALVGIVNGNHWGFAALAIVLAATRVQLRVPRLRWVFYLYYPAHLAGLWIAQRVLL